MIRRDDFDDPAPNVAPQCFLVGCRARRRAEDELGALEARTIQVVSRQNEILGAGFSPDFQAPRLRARDLLGGFGPRNVENLNRDIEGFCQCYDPIDGFTLGNHRLAPGVVLGCGQSCCNELFRHPGDQVVMLGMYANERLVATRSRQHAQDGSIIQPHAIVGHEDFDGAVSICHQSGQFLFDHARRRVGDRQVKRIIDDRLTGALVVVGRYSREGFAVLLPGERNDCRRTPGRGRSTARAKRVAQFGADRWLIQVNVAVDPARHHQQA